MNIHHLELFYFVAKHGGIAAAVRNIPYGIQQPAVSGQIAKLEESLGIKLFQRRPFALSPAGAELFEFIKPFFDNIDIVAERLRQNSSPQLRIAAPSIVLHDYLPQILECLRLKFPAFRLYLHEAARAEAERLLLARDVDLAIMLIDKKSRAGIQVRPLLELPLILLVHKKSKLARAEELWKRDKIEETLVSFLRTDPVHAYFQRGLDLLAQFRCVLVPVRRGRMLHCGVEDFLLRSRNFQRTVFFARIISAIDRFSLWCHYDLQFLIFSCYPCNDAVSTAAFGSRRSTLKSLSTDHAAPGKIGDTFPLLSH